MTMPDQRHHTTTTTLEGLGLFATMLSTEDAAEVFQAQVDRFDEVLAAAGAGE